MAYAEKTMLSAEEHVVMETALVEVMSTDHLPSEVKRVLMGTESSRTYVTEEIAQKLNLKSNESNNFINNFLTLEQANRKKSCHR